MFGFLNIDKPAGISSYDVIRHLQRIVPRRTVLGHAGTLDPFATGVLVVTLGRASRLVGYVQATIKEYRATIFLGTTSQTDDPDGPFTPTPGAQPPPVELVREAAARFVGVIQQTPPDHSAIRLQGQRAYQLARQGKAVDLKPRPVTVHTLELLSYDWPLAELHVTCGSGTYIRSLARDIGASLGVGGYCVKLARTRVGPFRIEHARPLEQVRPDADLILPLTGVADLPQFVVEASQVPAVAHGKLMPLTDPLPVGEVAIVQAGGGLLAIGRCDGQRVRPSVVLLDVGSYDGPGRRKP